MIRIGDRVLMSGNIVGRVVCCPEFGEYSDAYPEQEWRVLETGILVLTDWPNELIHVPELATVRVLDDEMIAAAWIEYMAREDPEHGDLKDDRQRRMDAYAETANWASDELMEFEIRDPDRLLQIILSISRQTTDPWVLCCLGAGPIEGLLHDRGVAVLDALGADIRGNPNLVTALQSVWSEGLTGAVKEGLKAIRGP